MFTRLWKSAGNARAVLGLLVVTFVLTCLVSTAFGQVSTAVATSSYKSVYYGNANIAGLPTALVDIVNPGSLAGYSKLDLHTPAGAKFGDLCANIYVFTSDQQMTECCSCIVTPNALLELRVDQDLTANPANGVSPHAGAIKIVSSYAGDLSNACNLKVTLGNLSIFFDEAALPYTPIGALDEWITHARPTTAGSITLTETPFHLSFLSSDGSELEKLQNQCYAIDSNGTGQGRCSCPAFAF